VSKRTPFRFSPLLTLLYTHLLTDFAHGTLSSAECVGQEKEFIIRLTNRERGEHCSSTSPSYSFSFPSLVFLLTYEQRGGEEENPTAVVVVVDETYVCTQDEREYIVEACERREEKKNGWWWLKKRSREREDRPACATNIYCFFSDNK